MNRLLPAILAFGLVFNGSAKAVELSTLPTNDTAYYVGKVNVHRPKPLVWKPFRAKAFVRHSVSHRQFKCYLELWTRESNWRHHAYNHTAVDGKHAYGIPQILDLPRRLSTREQIIWGMRYVNHRYGNACAALAFHDRHGWY